MWGDNLFCDPNLCVERLQTALQPSHPISQLITVRTIYCVCVCVCVSELCVIEGESMMKGMCYPSYPEEMF